MFRGALARPHVRPANVAPRPAHARPTVGRLPIGTLSRPSNVLPGLPVGKRFHSSFSDSFDVPSADGVMAEFMLDDPIADAAVSLVASPGTSISPEKSTSASPPPPSSSAPAEAATTSPASKPRSPRGQPVLVLPERRAGTFVSAHYKIDDSDIRGYLERKNMQFRLNTNEVIVKYCQFCPDHKDKPDNLWKLYISRDTGAWLCHRCGKSGSWFDLKRRLGDLKGAMTSWDEQKAPPREVPMPSQKFLQSLPAALKKYPDAIVYLTTQRGLQPSVIKFYKVGAILHSFPDKGNNWTEQLCITFPWITSDKDGNQTLVRYKLRALQNKANQRIEPKGGTWGLFGWHTIPADAKEIILTEGEYDAMAVYQATKMPTVSLPNGCRSLPLEVLPMLERFEKIYLWMDDDEPGQEGATKFAHKLGVERCWFVSTKDGDPKGPKDANDALRAGKDLKALLAKATKLRHQQIMTFDEMRNNIYNEIANPRSTAGIQSHTIPAMNRILKGHRRGELTIVTGATGIGKTSLLAQLSLDYAMQGVNTLWGSFEIKNMRLAKKMLTQFAAKDLSTVSKEEFDRVAEQFSALPLYFLRFFGSTQLEQVLDAMEYAVYTHDVEHIVLDNLQFLLSGQGVGFERFELQDKAIEAFRKFATLKNVHISLVIHPRKQEEDAPLTHASVFGTAKATQEADNVIILQKGKVHKYIEVKKNRFDGELGNIPLRFEKESNKFYELPADTANPPLKKQAPAKSKDARSHMTEFPI